MVGWLVGFSIYNTGPGIQSHLFRRVKLEFELSISFTSGLFTELSNCYMLAQRLGSRTMRVTDTAVTVSTVQFKICPSTCMYSQRFERPTTIPSAKFIVHSQQNIQHTNHDCHDCVISGDNYRSFF